MPYPLERKEAVLRKLLSPGARAISEVAREEGICTATLFNWRNAARAKGQLMPDSDEPTSKWSSEEKFAIVVESAVVSDDDMAAFCRSKGLYLEQLVQWRNACAGANQPAPRAQRRRDQDEVRADKKRIKELERDLSRKNIALSETAALLVLRKKANAIWGTGEDE